MRRERKTSCLQSRAAEAALRAGGRCLLCATFWLLPLIGPTGLNNGREGESEIETVRVEAPAFAAAGTRRILERRHATRQAPHTAPTHNGAAATPLRTTLPLHTLIDHRNGIGAPLLT